MGDTCRRNAPSGVRIAHPDHTCLFEIASSQHGYFTSSQARGCGFGTDLLAYHARAGRFVRVRRGLYRLRDYPSGPHEHVVAAWLAAGNDSAVVSHETALELLELSDVIPSAVHLTVPRTRRHLPRIPGAVFHTTTRPLGPDDVIERHGIRLTAPIRSILDAAEAGTAPEQIEMAISQAIRRAAVVPSQLKDQAERRGQRVARLVRTALGRASR